MSDAIPDPAEGATHAAHAAHGKLVGAFTNKIGPFPGYVWLLIMLVVGGAFIWWRRRNGGGSSILTGASGGTGDAAMTGDTLDPIAQSLPNVGGIGAGTVNTANGQSGASDFASWSKLVADALVAQGSNPSDVANALSAYASGSTLNSTQQAIINKAIQQFGSPPSGVLPVNTNQPNISYQPVNGDSLVSIATQFYGDPSRWKDIYAANKAVIGGDPLAIHSYMVLTLPGQGLLATPGQRSTPTAIPANHQYTIQYGDTLIQLAERFYGNGADWTKIYNANKGKIPNQNELQAGTVLQIPN